MSAEVAATSCRRRSCVDGVCATDGMDIPKDTSAFLNKGSRFLHDVFILPGYLPHQVTDVGITQRSRRLHAHEQCRSNDDECLLAGCATERVFAIDGFARKRHTHGV